MILGNDISKWQGDIDWNTYKNNSNFIIIKATEGVGFIDPKFSKNQAEARRVGLPLGYYHFARPDLGNTPEKEADYFLQICGQLQRGEMLVLDYECANQVQAWVDWCKKWLDYVTQKTNVKPLIYLNQSQVKNFNWQSVIDAGYGLWIAAYTGSPDDNSYNKGQWAFAAMQQWTNKQTVPGIAGGVDGNVFFGDLTTFKKYGFEGEIVTPPDPTPTPQPDCEKQVSGLKARNTDLTNQLSTATAEVTNRTEQVSRLKEQVLQNEDLRIDLVKQVNQATQKLDAVVKTYEGQLKGKQSIIDRLAKEKGELNKKLVLLETKGIQGLSFIEKLRLLF